MLRFLGPGQRLCDGLTRREWLRVGSLGSLGLSLSALAAGRRTSAAMLPQPSGFGRAKNCIILFLLGGPPQHETWDPKPEAPAEVRGEFGTIETATPGLRVCELMPLTARLTDRIAVLRAMSTRDNAHSSSGYWMLTGYPHQPTNAENATPGFPNDWPCVGAVVRYLRPDEGPLPAAIRLPEEIWNTGRIVWPGQDGGFLGRRADPWLLTCDPNAPDFQVPELKLPDDLTDERLQTRQTLFEQVNAGLRTAEESGAAARWQMLNRQAFELLSSAQARRAFRLEEEPDAVRQRYGRNRFGQSVLLARRLIEAGVSLVQVNWTRWEYDSSAAPAWDTHQKNAERLKTALMPPMDLAYSALLEDLSQRGLLDETLVVWMGEFGRTPRINSAGGRDHWGHVFSVALAGGGVRGGVVYGSSDRLGGEPVSGMVQPQDLCATIFHLLGHHPETEIRDALGRPLVISRGRVLHEVL
jgi:hypothetical protein